MKVLLVKTRKQSSSGEMSSIGKSWISLVDGQLLPCKAGQLLKQGQDAVFLLFDGHLGKGSVRICTKRTESARQACLCPKSEYELSNTHSPFYMVPLTFLECDTCRWGRNLFFSFLSSQYGADENSLTASEIKDSYIYLDDNNNSDKREINSFEIINSCPNCIHLHFIVKY